MRWWLAGLLVGCSVDANVARIPFVTVDAAPAEVSTKCPQKAGTATMIDLGDFCIDATEVTRGQYATFLASGDKTNVERCVDNTFETTADMTLVDHPMVFVDWCDAAAYCKWAGKRLCGTIGGGSELITDLAALNDPSKSEWYRACAGAAKRKYPYGETWQSGACTDKSIGKTTPVGARDCHGPPGTPEAAVYDLSGNVYEWVNSCQVGVGDPRMESCLTRGGSFLNEDAMFPWMTCAVSESPPTAKNTKQRQQSDDHIGIRCCAR